jgi:hypothetical protein
MDIDQRLGRLESRQEALISAVHGLTDVMEQTRDLVGELMAWLQEPAPSELPDLVKALAGAVQQQGELVLAMNGMLADLPAQVARAVRDGEVP